MLILFCQIFCERFINSKILNHRTSDGSTIFRGGWPNIYLCELSLHRKTLKFYFSISEIQIFNAFSHQQLVNDPTNIANNPSFFFHQKFAGCPHKLRTSRPILLIRPGASVTSQYYILLKLPQCLTSAQNVTANNGESP